MSSDFQLLLQSVEDLDDLKSTALEDVTKGKLTVVNLVETLEPYLVNKDEAQRLKGTSFLSSVLLEIPEDLLNEDEVNVLCSFFCDRLKDHFSVIPAALKGLQAVTNMKNLPLTAPDQVLINLTQNITCQTLHQTTRNTFYNILKNLFINKYEVIRNNSGDFVYSVISGMDSESDPRNLLFLFDFLPHPLSKLEFKHLTEEAFSVLECYFPVDFNSDKGAITRDDLAQGLENCFVSCPDFGTFVIPMVLEKMDSALKVAHMDSLRLLVKGYENWSVEVINPHMTDLWNAFKAAILSNAEPEVADLAIRALVGLIHKYASSPLSQRHSEALNQLLDNISSSTSRFLNDPTLSLFLPATKLLSAISQCSAVSCRHVVKTVVPQLLVLLSFKTNHNVVLTAFCVVLNASMKFDLWNQEENEEVRTTLLQVPNVLISKINDPTSRHGCFLCLDEIISSLTPEMRLEIMNTILKIIPQPGFTDRDSCVNFVKNIALNYPEEVKENILSKLYINEKQSEVSRKVDVLCWCTGVPPLLEYSLEEIINNLKIKEISPIVIKSLRDYCEHSADQVILHCFGTECQLIQKLIAFLKDTPKDAQIMQDYSKTIEAIVRCMLANEQQELVSKCMVDFSDELNFNNYIILIKGLLIALRPEVSIKDSPKLITKLCESYLKTDEEVIKSSSSILLASLINKHAEGPELEETLGILSESLNGHLKKDETRIAGASLYSCVVKSLVLRGHPLSNQWLDKLIDLLGDEELQLTAANGFKHILTQEDDLSEKNYCTIKLLYKQRIFCKIDQLVSLLDENSQSKKASVSLAISFILQSVPKTLIISGLKQLLKVIITCLESDDQTVVAAILEVVSNLLESGEEVFQEHIQTFIPKCLNCLNSPKMAVRMWALDCLFYYGKYSETQILPYRPMVLEGVQTCLDDKKRLVRQKAAKVRTRWYLVGSLPEK